MNIIHETLDNKPIGFLLVNKPQDTTSFRVVAQLRQILEDKKLKAGYAGTLDPFATGLLIVGVGRPATKVLHTITRWDKRYIARAKLGEHTDTLDRTGQVIELCNTNVTEEQLFSAIKRLGKRYTQIPPIYSALKHEGIPLYKLARHKKKSREDLQEALERKARPVQLHEITLAEVSSPFFTIEAHVSHGTYIRTLVDDIARNAGSCATTHELTRTEIGKIKLENAIDLEELQTPQDVEDNLISVEEFALRYASQTTRSHSSCSCHTLDKAD